MIVDTKVLMHVIGALENLTHLEYVINWTNFKLVEVLVTTGSQVTKDNGAGHLYLRILLLLHFLLQSMSPLKVI